MHIDQMPWGKYDQESGETHRLEHHCADVAACFEALVSEPVLRDRLNRAADDALHTTTLARLTVLAFLHDFAKVNAGFQFKVGGRQPGMPQPEGHVKPFFWACNRHEVVSGAGLHELTTWGPGLDPLLHAVLAHHGRPVTGHSVTRKGRRDIWQPFGGYDPIEAGRRLMGCARTWFPAAFRSGPDLPNIPRFAHLFAGVVAIADQIGSNEELFRREPLFDPAYIERARDQASAAVRKLGFARSEYAARSATPDFKTIFGEWSPRPMQRAVAEATLECPLLILESETGSGKTEAAIWRFARLWKAGLVDGLYFALPTRSAAKQLHGRVNRALGRMLPEEAHMGTVLAVPGYFRAGEATGRAMGWTVAWADDPSDEERLGRWSAESARKYLSATAAVGTVDQALLAGLRVKWAHFRGAALARSLLVVDEVHASDAYMTKVLEHVLQGHLEVGGHALLMSATLGSVARDALLVGGMGHRTRKPQALGTSYPVLTLHEPGGASRSRSFESSGYQRSVLMSEVLAMSKPPLIADVAIQAARRGAKVLVVRNTVGAATAVFDEVVARGSGALLLTVAGGPAVHHSRFAAEDRRLLDSAVEGVLGKERKTGGCVVVGTQTLEQSLDIDADLLITDLCPADVLLQRIGRLHRHHREERPQEFVDPRCLVLAPEGGLEPRGLSKYGLGMSLDGKGVYRDLRILELTRRLVQRHPIWTVPEMNRQLVEDATHPESLDALDDELGADWAARSREVDGRVAAERQVARRHALDRSREFESVAFPSREEAVRTRLGEDGPRIRLAEPAVGPFGRHVASFGIPAHLFRGGGGLPGKDEIDRARAEPGRNGLVLLVGPHRFQYNRGGLGPGP